MRKLYLMKSRNNQNLLVVDQVSLRKLAIDFQVLLIIS